MSEDARKDCRTQGKYSERSQYFDDKRTQKRQDKRYKGSPTLQEPHDRKFHKRKLDGIKSSNTSLTSENESPVRYEENSVHSFSQLKERNRPVEIENSGKYILSSSENGESVVFYEPYFFEEDEASDLMDLLHDSTNWNKKKIIINGAEVSQPRLVAWYGPFPYSYSGATLEPAEMPNSVLKIKEKVEDYLIKNGINVTLNSVLLNLYRDNRDSVAWHSDDELSMGVCPTIASVSLGACRKFEMRSKCLQTRDGNSHDKDDEYFIRLGNGSLLIMDGCMQKDWQHRVPKEYHDKGPRINLTFRTVYKLEDLPPSPGTYNQNQFCSSVLKKSSASKKTDFGVNYDDENFPPLNNGNSPICSNVRKSGESDATMGVKSSGFNGSHKWRSNGTSGSKTSLKNNDIAESSDIVGAEQFPSNNTCLKTDKMHSSGKIYPDEVSHNKLSSKTCVSGNEYSTKAFDNKISLKTDDEICDSEDYWDLSYSDTYLKDNGVINRSEDQDIESYSSEKTIILNNLNEDKKNVKIGMQSKNLHAYDSNFSGNNANAANTRKDKKESSSTNYVNDMHKNAHKVNNEASSDKNKIWTPNVKAKEFVPNFKCNSTVAENTFYDTIKLEDLLDYNVDLMHGDKLKSFSSSLKSKVWEKMSDFHRYQEELEVLCEITDGDQTEKNQKVITARMCLVVRKALKPPNFGKQPYGGNHRRFNQGNQNHYGPRQYQSSSRERFHRH